MFWVHGDIHNHVKEAQRFLDHEKPNRVIWLGDFFDNFNDTPTDATNTALWVRKTMEERPRDVFIFGNHDIPYRFPDQEKFHQYGFSKEKSEAIRAVLTEEHWSRFVLSHEEFWNGQTILFSHAGYIERFFRNEVYDSEQRKVLEAICLANGNKTCYNPLLDAVYGPIWIRWPSLPVMNGVCQVVGHTPQPKPAIRGVKGRAHWNLNLDCADKYYAVFKEKRAFAINRRNGMEHLLKFPDGTE